MNLKTKNNMCKSVLQVPMIFLYVLVIASSTHSHETNPASNVREMSHSSPHTLDFSVPPEQIDHVEESEAQLNAWERVARDCLPIEIGATHTRSCVESMSQFFLNEPVWKYSAMDMYDNYIGHRQVVGFPLNLRHRTLPYSSADFNGAEIPYWRDIFDGRVQFRKSLVSEVVADPLCKNLGDSRMGGIQPEMTSRCHGRELFKYATYLSSCTTAMERLHVLNSNAPLVKDKDSRQYEVSLKLIEVEVDSSLRELAMERIQRGYLHSKWMVDQCGDLGESLLAESQKITEVADDGTIGVFWNLPREKFYRSLQHTHRLTLTISAKTGDEWAIRSFPLNKFDGMKFLLDIQMANPILFHRHLGSRAGGFSRELSELDQRRHQAKAYLLMKDKLGSPVAENEFDASDLKREIDYVKQGGLLEMPRDREEIMREAIDEVIELLPEGTFPEDFDDLR